jgi:hypothetical protein
MFRRAPEISRLHVTRATSLGVIAGLLAIAALILLSAAVPLPAVAPALAAVLLRLLARRRPDVV